MVRASSFSLQAPQATRFPYARPCSPLGFRFVFPGCPFGISWQKVLEMGGKGLVEQAIDYTCALPNGAQVVIQGVPALCGEEDDFCAFSAEVAERLYGLIKMAEARNPAPGEVVTLPFDGLEGPHTPIGIE